MDMTSKSRTYGTEFDVTSCTTEGERTQLLEFVSFPENAELQEQINAAAQTPDSSGKVLCWRKRRQCNNPKCCAPKTGKPYRFNATDTELWNCPVCGHDRHCRNKVKLLNRGCHRHGGKTPTGWELPQTKSGEFSKHIKVDQQRAEFERLLASPQLLDISENIAFLKARIAEVTQEYGGGMSRGLLMQMKQNRNAYQRQMARKVPNSNVLRQLNETFDHLLNNGSSQRQVHADWASLNNQLMRLIAARDRHASHERLMMDAVTAWRLLEFAKETFTLGLDMMLEIEDEDVYDFLEAMGIHFEDPINPQQMLKMKEGLREFQKAKRKKILAYANKRFNELAGNGLG